MTQFRNFVFTINNYKELLPFNKDKMLYLVYQEEIGELGTPHLQGYCELVKRLTLSKVKLLLNDNTAHIEARKGTQKQATDYSKKEATRKEGTAFYEFGTAKEQGKRNDVLNYRDAVIAGKRERDIMMDDDIVPVLARYPRLYAKFSNMTKPKRPEDFECVLLIGTTGTGKSRYVLDKYEECIEDLYEIPVSNGTLWFDDYDKHPYALFDDFNGASTHMRLDALLRILDCGATKVPYKGGHMWFCPKVIYITTNVHPADWYSYLPNRMEHYWALMRRFTQVIKFTDKYEPQTVDFSHFWKNYAPQAPQAPQESNSFSKINGY